MINEIILAVVLFIKCGVKEFFQVLKRLDQVKKKNASRRKRRNDDRKKGKRKGERIFFSRTVKTNQTKEHKQYRKMLSNIGIKLLMFLP